MIEQDSIEEVKERANLIELVGESVSLKRQGSSYVGLCPFHKENTPSFHIRDGGKFYHCFGCGASGSAISYYMQTKGVSFPQAVEELAERFGVVLKVSGIQKDKKIQVDKAKFFEINKKSAFYFMKNLAAAPDAVKAYIKQRALKADTLKAFSVGFCASAWNSLSLYLKENKVSDEDILSLGLARRNVKGDLYDFFRCRLIFPIFSDNRKIAAFGGRLIPALLDKETQSQMPKYLNSSDSPVYQKSKVLFGLPQAMAAIRETDIVYVVEGYMDVLSLWQAGVKNVVATCGTALSEGHVKRLAYLCKRVFVLFDGDTAGRTAAAKTFTVFQNSGIDAKILYLPQGEDPDSIALRYGAETSNYIASLKQHTLLDVYIEFLLSRYGVTTVKELGAALKGQICREIAILLGCIKNKVEKSELLDQAAFKLMVDKSLLLDSAEGESVKISRQQNGSAEGAQQKNILAVSELPRLDQEILLSVMALKEKVAHRVLEDPDICSRLHSASLFFVENFNLLLADPSFSREELKDKIKELLKACGKSWLAHWKLAHDMSEDKAVNLSLSFEGCLNQIKKNKLNQSLGEIDMLIQETQDEMLKVELAQKRISLIKQINAI